MKIGRKSKDTMEKNDKGFSLIELVVVIAIMAILVGLIVVSLSTVFGTKALECAEKVSAKIDSVKTGSVSLYNETMELKYDTDGYYTECGVFTIDKNANSVAASDPEIRKVGAKNIVVKAYTTNGAEYNVASNYITISFDRSSGAFAPAQVNGAVVMDGTTPLYFDKITFSAGNRTYTLQMVPETGKHSITRN